MCDVEPVQKRGLGPLVLEGPRFEPKDFFRWKKCPGSTSHIPPSGLPPGESVLHPRMNGGGRGGRRGSHGGFYNLNDSFPSVAHVVLLTQRCFSSASGLERANRGSKTRLLILQVAELGNRLISQDGRVATLAINTPRARGRKDDQETQPCKHEPSGKDAHEGLFFS